MKLDKERVKEYIEAVQKYWVNKIILYTNPVFELRKKIRSSLALNEEFIIDVIHSLAIFCLRNDKSNDLIYQVLELLGVKF